MVKPQACNRQGFVFVAMVMGLTSLALHGAQDPRLWVWAASQGLLALALVQWFVLLHEAGHGTLFRSARANRWVGHLAGAWALIPFESWRRIHAMHHRFTGWQDLDPTTALLVPRPLSLLERRAVNVAWRCMLPLFSVAYRVQNFWNIQRVLHFLPGVRGGRDIRLNVWALVLVYATLVLALGPQALARWGGVGLILSLVVQDFLILGQHTHMPMGHSQGQPVALYAPSEQVPFTRSVLLPRWLSWSLLGFDHHGLHHRYPRVPGYALHRLGESPANAVHWRRWRAASRRLCGTDFLFGRREQTGLKE